MIKETNNPSRKLINNQEMVLIKNSEAAKDIEVYGNLFESIKDKKFLTLSEFNKTTILDDKAKTVVLVNKSTLINNIIQEWSAFASSLEADGEVHCQLCNTKNKWVYYIRNKHNSNELNVGSECVKKFPNIENVNLVKKSHNEAMKQYNKDKRRIEFGELEMNEPNFVSDAHDNFINIDILLPYDLHTSISKTIYNLRFIKTNYIESGGDIDEISIKYYNLKNEMKDLWNEALLFFEQNKNKKLICKKYMSDWLKDNHSDIWERVSKNNGMFDETTLEYAYHSKFVSKFISDFRKCLNDNFIKIIKVEGDSILFAIQNENYKTPFYFLVKNKLFMSSIGCHCLVSHRYIFTHLDLNHIYIIYNTDSFFQLHNRMSSIMKKVGFDIIKSQYSETYYFKRLPKIIHESKWSSKIIESEIGYKRFSINTFFVKCTSLLFADNKIIEQEFIKWYSSFIMSKSNWLTEKQKDELEYISSKSSYQKQKEFV